MFFKLSQSSSVNSSGSLLAVKRWRGCKSFTAASIRRRFSRLNRQQMSKSRVTSEAPCKTPQTPPMMTNSTFCSLSRDSSPLSFCGMMFSCFLQFENHVQGVLMLFEPLFRRHPEGVFDERHVESIFSRRAPRGPGIWRHGILAVHLRQCFCVEHLNHYFAF